MKSSRAWALLAVLAVGGAAYAANFFETVATMWGGFYAHPRSITVTSANKVTRMLGAPAVFDFLSATTTCTTLIADGGYSTLVLTGAQVGDPCFVGANADGGATHSNFTCYVSATNEVTVKACSAGTASDPAIAPFNVRVISSQ